MVIRDVVIISLSPQPLADDAGTLLAIGRRRGLRIFGVKRSGKKLIAQLLI